MILGLCLQEEYGMASFKMLLKKETKWGEFIKFNDLSRWFLTQNVTFAVLLDFCLKMINTHF